MMPDGHELGGVSLIYLLTSIRAVQCGMELKWKKKDFPMPFQGIRGTGTFLRQRKPYGFGRKNLTTMNSISITVSSCIFKWTTKHNGD